LRVAATSAIALTASPIILISENRTRIICLLLPLLSLENAFLLLSLSRRLSISLLLLSNYLPRHLLLPLLPPNLLLRHLLSLKNTFLFTRLSRRLSNHLLLLAKDLLRHLLPHLPLCLRLRLRPKLRLLPHLRLTAAAVAATAVRIFHLSLLSGRGSATSAISAASALTVTFALAVNVLIQAASKQKCES